MDSTFLLLTWLRSAFLKKNASAMLYIKTDSTSLTSRQTCR